MARAKTATTIAQEIIALCDAPGCSLDLATVVKVLQDWQDADRRDANNTVQMLLADVGYELDTTVRRVAKIRRAIEQHLYPKALD